jgi:hypothetical protein
MARFSRLRPDLYQFGQKFNVAWNTGNLFASKLDLNLRRKIQKCYIWNIALYGAETWTLRKVDEKYLKVSKRGAEEEWRRSLGQIV